MKTKSTKVCSNLTERDLPPTHFPALLNLFHTTRTSNLKQNWSCFLEKALSAGQGDLTHQPHIPEGKEENEVSEQKWPRAPKWTKGKNKWVLLLWGWNPVVMRLPCYWSSMHFHITFKVLGWGNPFNLGTQLPLLPYSFFSTHSNVLILINQSLLSLSTSRTNQLITSPNISISRIPPWISLWFQHNKIAQLTKN